MHIYTDPWPHIIIDDFLPDDGHIALYNQARNLTSKRNLKPLFKYDLFEKYDLEQYLEVLPHRPYNKLEKLIHYAKTPFHYQNKIHCDIESKILSAVLYLGPNENIGTSLYRKDNRNTFVKMTEWKPNRMFIFCGVSGTTWHKFSANHLDRYTLNWFLINSDWKHPDAFAY